MDRKPKSWGVGKVDQVKGQALSYWTRERMLNSTPLPLEKVEVGEEGPPEVIFVSQEDLDKRRLLSEEGKSGGSLGDTGKPIRPAANDEA